MFFLIEFLIYLFFIFYLVYSLFDQLFLYTDQGGKIDKYIKKYDFKNISNNFEKTKNNKISFFIKSPNGRKYVFYSIFSTLVILTIKMVLTYEFLLSDYYIISIFEKKINLKNIFENNYFILKIFYYSSFYIFYYVLSLKLIYKYKLNKKTKNEHKIVPKQGILLGRFKEQNVIIEKNGLYQNILITGSIGSGKTSTAVTTIVSYFIDNNISGLLLDVKGNYIDKVRNIMNNSKSNLNINVISKCEGIYNPIDIPNISAYELANRIKKVLVILSEKNNSDSYWLDKAESYIKDFIVLIRAYNDFVSFNEIHNLCIDGEYLENKIDEIKHKVLSGKLSEKEIFEINNSICNLKNEYMELDDRTKNIIRSEITRMTDVFVSDYEICNKFCSKNLDEFSLTKGINVLSLNMGENKKLAKIIATYLKLNFQSEVLQNNNDKDVFFVCDEYQEFCNEEDGHFFSLSREYKCINVVAMQSYSSLKNSLRNEDSSKVIIQNFVNKIWLRNDDTYTVEEIIKQLGKEEKSRTNISISENSQDSKYSIFSKKFKNMKSGMTESYTISDNMEQLLDNSYFTKELKTFEAVCLLSNGIKCELYKKVLLNMWKVGKKYENESKKF